MRDVGGVGAISNDPFVQEVDVAQRATLSPRESAWLRENLIRYFAGEELRTLCHDLGVDYDDLKGEGKTARARDLIVYLDHRGRISELIEKCIELRPQVHWREATYVTPPEQAPASEAERQAVRRAKEAVYPQARRHLLFSPAPLPKGLVGREAEISTLLEALKDPELTIIWIGGIPGIGKTYLAARLHREVSEQGECQPLWMDCKERSVTLEVLLDALAELSGDPELLKLTQDPSTRPEDRVEQVLQRFMEPQKVVLFVEDYHRLEGLGEHHRLDELLIQAARHCEQTKIILVGRVRPGVLDNHRLHGAFLEHPMEGLGEEYTREFVNIPNLTDEQAHKIWKQCASGTPIAMSIFGQEVNKRSLSDLLALPIWGIANTKQQWLDPVVENLTLSERACLQAASVFSADIPHSALAYIYDRDDLQSAMDGLLDKGLLVHKPGSDRYAVWHDIIRDYVSDRQIIPLARDEFEQRLVEYYAQFVLENLYKPEQLRSESANILGAMKSWRRKQRGALRPVTELLQLMLGVEEHEALKIALSTGELAHRSGDVKWAAEIYNEVSDLARRKNYVVELAKALLQLSFLAELEGDNSLAMRYLTEGLQAARRSEDHTIVPDIVGKLAYLYSSQNEHEKAYALYREERDNLSGAPLAHLLCGIVPRLFEMSSFDEAWDCIQKAQNILREESNVGAFAYTWRLQGDWYWKQDKLEKAEESFKEEEQLRRSAVEGDEQEVKYLFEIMWKQVRFFQETNQLDKARQCMARFKAIQSIPAWLMPQLLGHEAVLLVALGDYRGASQRCQEAMTIYREQGILGGSAWIQRIQGDIQAAQGKFKEAVKIYEAGLELRSRLGESERTAEDLEHLAEFYIRQMHDVEQACKYLERAQQQFQRVDARKASALAACRSETLYQ